MTDQQIIYSLGGNAALAIKIGEGVSHHNIKHWGKRGIPWKWRSYVAKVAKKEGLKLPDDFLHHKCVSKEIEA